MKSILFGSIGSVVESSEIQRKAFNAAFKELGLEWYWNIANYIRMLQKPGGLNRLIEYSKNELNLDYAKQIHLLKIKHFKLLSKNRLKPRDGVLEVIQYALNNNIKIGFITTTTIDTLDLVIDNLSNQIDFSKFDLITHDQLINNYNTPGSLLNLLNFANTNDVDLTKINLKDFIKKIIAEKKYKKDQFVKQLLYSLIELYFRQNVSLKNINLLKIQNYFLKKINDTKIFNLDDETLLMEFEERVLNG